MLDVVVVGGGPAGLSAALMLARCRRTLAVIDAGSPRNAKSHGVHGFLSRDGILPADLLRCGREDLSRYGVRPTPATVVDATKTADGFSVSLDTEGRVESRRLLLATGVVDCLPPIDGFGDCYGVSVFHCQEIVFRTGDPLARRALFFDTGQYTRSPLAERLGCRFTSRGAVHTNELGESSVPGVYVAGDASRDVQFVVVAAAEGAKVAYAINIALQKADGAR